MKTHLIIVFYLVAVFVGCEDQKPHVMGDHTWDVTYFVRNESSIGLMVVASGPLPERCNRGRVSIGSGETIELDSYQAFLAPPPDAGRDFTCISVYRAIDQELVFQLAPVKNADWSRKDVREFQVEFTLSLGDNDLSTTGLLDACARLRGTVRDSITSEPIVSAYIVHIPESHRYREVRTDSLGDYELVWSDTIPDGDVLFLKQSYWVRQLRVPNDAIVVNSRLYQLDALLAPEDTDSLN